MKKQRWEESEKRREEERRSKKRKSQKKEDARRRKGRLEARGVRAVVGLQYLFGPASETPQCSNCLWPGLLSKERQDPTKNTPQMEAQICIVRAQDVQGNATYV